MEQDPNWWTKILSMFQAQGAEKPVQPPSPSGPNLDPDKAKIFQDAFRKKTGY